MVEVLNDGLLGAIGHSDCFKSDAHRKTFQIRGVQTRLEEQGGGLLELLLPLLIETGDFLGHRQGGWQVPPEGPSRLMFGGHVDVFLELFGLWLGISPQAHGFETLHVLRPQLVALGQDHPGHAIAVAVQAHPPRMPGEQPGNADPVRGRFSLPAVVTPHRGFHRFRFPRAGRLVALWRWSLKTYRIRDD